MKTKSALKQRCAFCKIVKRKRVLYVSCKIGKHKQKQG